MEQPGKQPSSEKIHLSKENLKIFFLDHLNKIYAAKAHLVRRLPELANQIHFNDLHQTVMESIENVEKQMARMEVIFTLMDAEITDECCHGVTGLINDAFEAIMPYQKEMELRDLSLLFYMQNIESVEMGSFQVLQVAAVKLKNKQVARLLQENYDDAKANRTLMVLIAAKYVTSK